MLLHVNNNKKKMTMMNKVCELGSGRKYKNKFCTSFHSPAPTLPETLLTASPPTSRTPFPHFRTHSLNHSLSLARSLTHSLFSLTHPPLLAHSLTRSSHSLTHSLAHSQLNSLTHPPTLSWPRAWGFVTIRRKFVNTQYYTDTPIKSAILMIVRGHVSATQPNSR